MSSPEELSINNNESHEFQQGFSFCPRSKQKLLTILCSILSEVSASSVILRLKSRSISEQRHQHDDSATLFSPEPSSSVVIPDKHRRASDKAKVPNGDYILQVGEHFQAKGQSTENKSFSSPSSNTMSTPIYSQRRLIGELLIETPPETEANNRLRIYLLNASESISIIVSGNDIPKKDVLETQAPSANGHNEDALPGSTITDRSSFFKNIDLEKEHPAISKAIIYISEHYRRNFCMRDLSKACYISPSHLSNLLNKRFGMSFKKILTHFRVEKAKDILREMPARQITQVCIDVGFFDLSHFEKTFKRTEGLSPTAYRAQHRKQLDITKSHKAE